MPIGTLVSPETLVLAGISAAGSMFLSAAIIMTPIAMTLLMVNVTVGVISRSAPSLNLFSFGFPITLMAVFILLYMSVGGIAISAESLIESGLTYSQNLMMSSPMAEDKMDRKRLRSQPLNDLHSPRKKDNYFNQKK